MAIGNGFMNDIDEFYSENSTSSWLKVLGPKRHYHFGQTNPHCLTEDFMDYATRSLYRFIPSKSKILDCGAGWGGPAELLIQEKECDVVGITISQNQYEFISHNVKKMKCILADLESYQPKEHFDIALFIESFCHLKNKQEALCRLNTPNLLLSDWYCKNKSVSFSKWQVNFLLKEELIETIEKSGYELIHFEETLTLEDLKKSAQYWLKGIESLEPKEIFGQIKLLKEACYFWLELPILGNFSKGIFFASKLY